MCCPSHARTAGGSRRPASSARGRPVEQLERLRDVRHVEARSHWRGPLLEAMPGAWLPGQSGADEIVHGLAEAYLALAADGVDRCGDIGGQGDRRPDAPIIAS